MTTTSYSDAIPDAAAIAIKKQKAKARVLSLVSQLKDAVQDAGWHYHHMQGTVVPTQDDIDFRFRIKTKRRETE